MFLYQEQMIPKDYIIYKIMMKFKTYSQFINESERHIKFSSIYNFTLEWWAIWQEKFKDKFEIKQNAVSKIYTIFDKKTKEPVFIYDYQKETVYTDKIVSFFKLPDDENLTTSELEKKVKAVEDKINPSTEEDKTVTNPTEEE